MKPNIKCIYLVWRPGRSHRRIVIGKVKANKSEVSFQYIKEGVEEAHKSGFMCYPDFLDVNKKYTNKVLHSISQRLNDPGRTDIADYYKFWNISKKMTTDKIRLIAQTSGCLPTDNFEFLADFYGAKGVCLVSELAGLSNVPLENGTVSVGDKLTWTLEPANEYDKDAVAVYKDAVKIGYIKKIHNRLFHHKGSKRLNITVKKIEHNGHINKVFMDIKYL